ncbi:hypothetical protein OH77DRAFT_920984 [Trametes cingulata]|nr:hypothetical protein OH77DRAFT_920984 [Trametes cingulata]
MRHCSELQQQDRLGRHCRSTDQCSSELVSRITSAQPCFRRCRSHVERTRCSIHNSSSLSDPRRLGVSVFEPRHIVTLECESAPVQLLLNISTATTLGRPGRDPAEEQAYLFPQNEQTTTRATATDPSIVFRTRWVPFPLGPASIEVAIESDTDSAKAGGGGPVPLLELAVDVFDVPVIDSEVVSLA